MRRRITATHRRGTLVPDRALGLPESLEVEIELVLSDELAARLAELAELERLMSSRLFELPPPPPPRLKW